MTDDHSPNLYFSVQLGDGVPVKFAEVSGLEADSRPIEYRHGDNPSFYPIKMPGLGKVGNVTMRRGIVGRDSEFWKWLSEIQMNRVIRRTVTISLLDEGGAPARVWTLHNAWPAKISGPALDAKGNEVMIELLELANETIEMSSCPS
ncbi:MAG: phage tail protein [Alphaproteobacteria bacterium]